jgi:hypothetical protein
VVNTAEADGFHGTVTVTELDGASAQRTVSARSCEEVVTALALVTALAIVPEVDSPAANEDPALIPKAMTHPDVLQVSSGPGRRAIHVNAGAQLAVFQGVAPTAMIGIPVFLEARQLLGQRSWRVGFAYAASDTTAANGRASFSWMAAHLQLCPVGVERHRTFLLESCAWFEVGGLSAAGAVVANPRAETRLWLAPGILGRVRWRVSPRVFTEIEIGAGFPLIRDRFYFGPADTTIHQVPWLTETGRIGLGVSFL